MRRLVPLAAAAVATAILTAPAAQADTISGGTLINSVATTATVNVAGDQVEYFFTAAVDEHVTFDVTASVWNSGDGAGSARLRLFRPGSASSVNSCTLRGGPIHCEFTLDTAGSWRLLVDPNGESTGSATFTYAQDLSSRALASTKKVSTEVAVVGQRAHFTFEAVKGRHLTFDVSKSVWNSGNDSGSAQLVVYAPNAKGSWNTWRLRNRPAYLEFTPDATGTWRAVLDPYSDATGSATFAYAKDVATKKLKKKKPVTTKIAFRGRNAAYTVAAKSGKRVTLSVGSTRWRIGQEPGSAELKIYPPGSNTVFTTCDLADKPKKCRFTPDDSGTWRVRLDPDGASVGKIKITRL